MFPAPDGKTYEPYKVKTQKKEVVRGTDVEMKDGGEEGGEEEVEEIVELPEDEEGAVFPLKGMISPSQSRFWIF
jgi:actin-related protein 9